MTSRRGIFELWRRQDFHFDFIVVCNEGDERCLQGACFLSFLFHFICWSFDVRGGGGKKGRSGVVLRRVEFYL